AGAAQGAGPIHGALSIQDASYREPPRASRDGLSLRGRRCAARAHVVAQALPAAAPEMNAAVVPAPHPGGARAMIEKAVLALVVGTIAIAPVPLGSNRAWAWAALSACTAAALATWLLLWATGGVAVSRPLRKSWPVFALLAVWIANLAVSLGPLPVSWGGR